MSALSRCTRSLKSVCTLLLATAALLQSTPLFAHHSAALFYSMSEHIKLTGEVARYNFRNPHAIVELLVKNEKGEIVKWTCETSAPSALRRRGWSQESIQVGETITFDGIPARDGSLLMRITTATKADGSQIGAASVKIDD